MRSIFLGSMITVSFSLCSLVQAEVGVSENEVLIGMTNALSGPAQALGTGVKTGSLVYFEKVNRGGGVYGRKIRVISYDDGYEPRKTVGATRKLVDEDKVFVLFGYVGTPTSTAVVPIISRIGIPYLFPFTGAQFLRHPVNKVIFNVRSSYFDETEGLVNRLVNDLKIERIGVFIQDDAYGAAGKSGVERALRKRGLRLTGEGRYQRNTEDVDAGIDVLKKANPQAVVMIGAYKPCASFIKKSKQKGFSPLFLNVSFVGSKALAKELGAVGNGVIISQVMPNPHDTSLPMVKQYRDDMKGAGHEEASYTSLEGYVNAMVFVKALEKAGKNLTRVQFLSALESLNSDFGGLRIGFSGEDHQGLKGVYLTKIDQGQIVSINTLR